MTKTCRDLSARCKRFIRYTSRAAAEAHIKELLWAGFGFGLALYAFHCVYCRGWHINAGNIARKNYVPRP